MCTGNQFSSKRNISWKLKQLEIVAGLTEQPAWTGWKAKIRKKNESYALRARDLKSEYGTPYSKIGSASAFLFRFI